MCVTPNYPNIVLKTRSKKADIVPVPRGLYTLQPHEALKEESTVNETGTINLDLLEFDLKSNLLDFEGKEKSYSIQNVKVERSAKNLTKQYNYTYTVKVNSILIGHVFLSMIKEKVINKDITIIPFRLANEIFSRNNGQELINTFFNSFKVTHTLTEVHIANDRHGLIEQFAKEEKNGYTLNKSFKFTRTKVRKQVIAYKLGSSKADKTYSLYNKSKDIEQTGKQYITDFHNANNLDTSKQIDRLELRLKKKEIKKIQFDWKKGFNSSYLFQILKAYIDKDLVLIHETDYTYTSTRNKKYKMKPLYTHLDGYLPKQFVRIDETTVLDSNYANKVTARTLYNRYLETEDASYFEALRLHLKRSMLTDWFIKKESQIRSKEIKNMTDEIEAIISDLRKELFLNSLVLSN